MSGVPLVTTLADAIAARLNVPPAGTPGATYLSYRSTSVPMLEPHHLPALLVFVMDGVERPDGDGNAGEPCFVCEDRIGVAVVRATTDQVVAEGLMAAELERLKATLLTDPSFVTFGEGSLFESISEIRRRWLMPQHGEQYFVEGRLEFVFVRRTGYPPVVPDEYRELAVTYKPGDRVGDPGAPTIERKWVENTWEDQFP